MAQTHEEKFLEFLKHADAPAEMTVREDPPGIPDPNTEAVNFSDAAQESNQDGRQGMADRVLSHKNKSDVAARALIGAVIDTKDYETSSVQLKPGEKVSFVRSPTLMQAAVSKFGRL